MITLHFQCKLLADIILNASSATAQTVETLEFIPAAKFLGVAAKTLYKSDAAKNKAIFHSAKVRFSDAHLAKNGVRSLKIPFDFMTAKKPKTEHKNTIWLNNLLSDEERKTFPAQGIQLQQKRKGFFIANESLAIETLESPSSYSLKSAYDADQRRTKSQQMFGYNAIKKGSTWLFSVEIDEDLQAYAAEIKAALVGEHSLGKSRSAQYGRVEITAIEANKSFAKTHTHSPNTNTVVLYAESNCCFFDDCGQYTVKPTLEHLFGNVKIGEKAEIDWRNSQIRHRVFAPWNIQRAARDADRWIIEKGSVLILQNVSLSQQEITNLLAKGVGEFRTEGYGKFLVNPDFLCQAKTLESKEKDKETPKEANKEEATSQPTTLSGKAGLIQQMLKKRQEKATNATNIISDLSKTITDTNIFKDITASQWGQIRAYAQNIKNWSMLKNLLFDKSSGFLYTAKRKDIWSEKAITALEKLADADKIIVFASEMAKIAKQNPKEN